MVSSEDRQGLERDFGSLHHLSHGQKQHNGINSRMGKETKKRVSEK